MANAQGSDQGFLCANVTLQFDSELLKLAPQDIDRTQPVVTDQDLSAAHLTQLAVALRNCGDPSQVRVEGVATNPTEPAGQLIILRQSAAKRINRFIAWAQDQGLQTQNLIMRTNGKQEPIPSAILLQFFGPAEVDNVPTLVAESANDGAETIAQSQELESNVSQSAPQQDQPLDADENNVSAPATETIEVSTAAVEASPSPEPVPIPEPADPCDLPFVIEFGGGVDKAEQDLAFEAYLEECEGNGDLAVTVQFNELSATTYAAWLGWNVATSSKLRPIVLGQ